VAGYILDVLHILKYLLAVGSFSL